MRKIIKKNIREDIKWEEMDLDAIIACGLDPNPEPQPFDYDIRAAAKYIEENNIKNGLTLEQLKMFERK